MLAKPFTEDQDPLAEDAASNTQEPEYTFEGFTVEFSEKIVLTPPRR
jgi:hypothetical protein